MLHCHRLHARPLHWRLQPGDSLGQRVQPLGEPFAPRRLQFLEFGSAVEHARLHGRGGE